MVSPNLFQITGLDFLLGKNGEVILLEVNDSPVGLKLADDLASSVNGNSLFEPRSIETLTDILIQNSKSSDICLLLPDRYVIQNKNTIFGKIKLLSSNGGSSSHLLVEDFNSILLTLKNKGKQAFICDRSEVRVEGREVFAFEKCKVGTLYTKALFPDIDVECSLINDLRVRHFCRNKYLCQETIAKDISSEYLPDTLPICDLQSIKEIILKRWGRDSILVAKPNYGFGSMGISLHSAAGLLDRLDKLEKDYIVQKWIHPVSVSQGKNDYFFDIRIFLINGQPVGGFARRAMAPTTIDLFNPLCWLTTWGPNLPLSSKLTPRSVTLNGKQVELMFELSTIAINRIDKEASLLPYTKTVKNLPDFYNSKRLNKEELDFQINVQRNGN